MAVVSRVQAALTDRLSQQTQLAQERIALSRADINLQEDALQMHYECTAGPRVALNCVYIGQYVQKKASNHRICV